MKPQQLPTVPTAKADPTQQPTRRAPGPGPADRIEPDAIAEPQVLQTASMRAAFAASPSDLRIEALAEAMLMEAMAAHSRGGFNVGIALCLASQCNAARPWPENWREQLIDDLGQIACGAWPRVGYGVATSHRRHKGLMPTIWSDARCHILSPMTLAKEPIRTALPDLAGWFIDHIDRERRAQTLLQDYFVNLGLGPAILALAGGSRVALGERDDGPAARTSLALPHMSASRAGWRRKGLAGFYEISQRAPELIELIHLEGQAWQYLRAMHDMNTQARAIDRLSSGPGGIESLFSEPAVQRRLLARSQTGSAALLRAAMVQVHAQRFTNSEAGQRQECLIPSVKHIQAHLRMGLGGGFASLGTAGTAGDSGGAGDQALLVPAVPAEQSESRESAAGGEAATRAERTRLWNDMCQLLAFNDPLVPEPSEDACGPAALFALPARYAGAIVAFGLDRVSKSQQFETTNAARGCLSWVAAWEELLFATALRIGAQAVAGRPNTAREQQT